MDQAIQPSLAAYKEELARYADYACGLMELLENASGGVVIVSRQENQAFRDSAARINQMAEKLGLTLDDKARIHAEFGLGVNLGVLKKVEA